MQHTFLKGTLEKWDEDKGFGFIQAEDSKRTVFIHISAFKKKISRRPIIGDTIFYQIHTANDGKKRAVNVNIEGVKSVQAVTKKRPKRHVRNKQPSSLPKWVAMLVLSSVGFYAYNQYTSQATPSFTIQPVISAPARESYSCDGRQHCSQMTSCAEAMFYNRNCPNTKMDGDGDGVPCESQWCM